jgi:CheY-like chemotaxis protein
VIEPKATILHVEDDASLQKLVRTALEQLGGYAVLTAANGFRALELARQAAPQLLLLDLDLPGMDGVETLHRLRRIEGLQDVPAIFLTAASDARVTDKLRAVGVREVLAKPFRPRRLVQAVVRALAPGGE